MLASTVSSRMLAAMARAEGFEFWETLTGFKWLGNMALELEQRGPTPLFAFEEAIGFMFGGMIKVGRRVGERVSGRAGRQAGRRAGGQARGRAGGRAGG